MNRLSPFRALRFAPEVAGNALPELVAPPYDVIGEDMRYALSLRNPHNMVHLTLPESPEAAGKALAEWREKGVLVEEEPALYWITQDFVGPDGVARTREGIAGSVEATPYSEGKVLPHERTHAGPKEGRLKVLRATRTQLEPIFLLYDADPPVSRPEGEPIMDVEDGFERTRVWRIDSDGIDFDVPFLIADGHHRYETAVTFREEEPSATHTFAVLVSARDAGLQIYPTHRTVERIRVEPDAFMSSTWDMSALAMYQLGNFYRIDSTDELDTREIEQYELEGVEYTHDAEAAVQAVDDEEAYAAFLVRAPTIEQVFEFAKRGETMPQKTTFFYPKLLSGLLLHPI